MYESVFDNETVIRICDNLQAFGGFLFVLIVIFGICTEWGQRLLLKLRLKHFLVFFIAATLIFTITTFKYLSLYRTYRLYYRNAEIYQLCYPQNMRELRKLKVQADIVYIGDSITEMFPAELLREVNASFMNLGVGGDTTLDMLARFDEVVKYRPTTIIILGGAGDFFQKFNLPTIKNNLKTMVQIAQTNGIKVYVATLLPTFEEENRAYYQDELTLNNWIRGNFDCIDYFLALASGNYMNPKYSVDGTHPTYAGFVKMAEVLTKELK